VETNNVDGIGYINTALVSPRVPRQQLLPSFAYLALTSGAVGMTCLRDNELVTMKRHRETPMSRAKK
jgi:hypothetical protein